MRKPASLGRQCVSEMIGTFILVFFGIGSVHAGVLTGTQQGLWQVAVVWGIAISLAIYATGAVSGAHINPAMTVAFAACRGFPWRRAPWYIFFQFLGAVLAAIVLYVLFSSILGQFESAHGIVRGSAGSELSAMVYGEYFPNPAVARSLHWTDASISHAQAMLAEGIGTAFLTFFVFAVTDARNRSGPGSRLAPLFIGLTVSILISVIAPLTQAGFNPARDFGPRLFAYFAGWGSVAIPGPRGGFFTVYILAPVLGAVLGGAFYQCLVAPTVAVVGRSVRQQYGIGLTTGRTHTMKRVRFMFVGGFLGAGKTTLLWHAAELLVKRGKRVGLITNDQAPDLVDTKWLAEKGLNVREVAGSCFCCNFAGLIYAAEKLLEVDADVLIGEPVGSCTDLSATILQPLKDRFKEQFVLSPLSVLADPLRLRDVLGHHEDALHASAAYIYRKQLEEADLVVINKADLLSPEERTRLEETLATQLPGLPVRFISARTGEGVEPWLDEVLSPTVRSVPVRALKETPYGVTTNGPRAGSRIAEIDYDIYAEGEAVLGWLNADIRLSAISDPVEWGTFCRDLLNELQAVFQERSARIGHVKLLLTTSGGHCVGNLTDLKGRPFWHGEINGSPPTADLTLNARVEMSPEELERVVRDTLSKIAGRRVRIEIIDLRCLRPGRPQPTYRYDKVVG